MIAKLLSSFVILVALAVPATAGVVCANSACTDDRQITYSAQQTFSLAPIFTTLTGYLKGNGASGISASSTIPSADFADGNTGTGAVAHANSPAFVTPALGVAAATSLTITGDVATSLTVNGGTQIGNSAFGRLGASAAGDIGIEFGRSAQTSGATTIQGVKNGAGANPLTLQPSGGATNIGGSANIAGTLALTAATWANNQTCTAGQISVDASYIYVCTAANTVKRAALTAF